MDRNQDIRVLLAEEQTLLSWERTMHSCIQAGLASCSVGFVIIKFLTGAFYFCAGVFFLILGALLIVGAGTRYVRFQRAIVRLREREAKLGDNIGTIK